MHSSIQVIGPGAMVILFLYFVVWGLSLYVVVDSLRRGPVDYTGVREGRWFYALPQGAYFLLFGVNQIPQVARAVPSLGIVALAAILPVIAHQVAYLLRVVFPTRARVDARLEAKERALAEEFGLAYDGVGLDGVADTATDDQRAEAVALLGGVDDAPEPSDDEPPLPEDEDETRD